MSEKLSFDQVNNPGFFVIGISVRTTNKNGQSSKDIGDLWTRFTTQNLAAQIPGKVSDDTYCVYTDYESDHTGWYTAVLGCRVSDTSHAPDGFFTAYIPDGDYRVYTPQGKFPDCIANAWMEIWVTDIPRKYTADYDLYKAGAKSFEETEVEIYLSV